MDYINTIIIILILVETTVILLQNLNRVKNRSAKPIFMDTSVLMDSRILSIIDAGLLTNNTLIVPKGVIAELQGMADSTDTEKRLKARSGLDLILKIKAKENTNVKIKNYNKYNNKPVDDLLIKLCLKFNGILLSLDYNLIKVAQVENIQCININELAKNLRLSYLPGEQFTVLLSQKGNERSQAVGYLEDGTMVIVGNAKNLIGKKIDVECTRSLQTDAGRMIFAKLK